MPLSNASVDARIFEQVASALTVKSICSPFGMDIPAGSTVSDLPELFSDRAPKQGPFRVVMANLLGIDDAYRPGAADHWRMVGFVPRLNVREILL